VPAVLLAESGPGTLLFNAGCNELSVFS